MENKEIFLRSYSSGDINIREFYTINKDGSDKELIIHNITTNEVITLPMESLWDIGMSALHMYNRHIEAKIRKEKD